MAVELLPKHLYWAPHLQHVRSSGAAAPAVQVPNDAHVLKLEDYASDPHIRGGVYCVPHYRPEASGEAVGPLALDQVVAFAGLLSALLTQHERVVVVTDVSDKSRSANAAVLTGAFLMIMEGWGAGEVVRSMGPSSRLKFPCSWTRVKTRPALLTVADCWQGLQIALDRNWLDRKLLQDPMYLDLMCHQYSSMLNQYDVAWLAPYEVMVGADPATVICDPDPATCSKLEPPMLNLPTESICRAFGSLHTESTLAPSIPSHKHSLPSTDGGDSDQFDIDLAMADLEEIINARAMGPMGSQLSSDMGEIPEEPSMEQLCLDASEKLGGSPLSTDVPQSMPGPTAAMIPHLTSEGEMNNKASVHDSIHTVCKEYRTTTASNAAERNEELLDFVTWFQQKNINTIIRANFSNEPGLSNIGGSYDSAEFERHGMKHVELHTVDRAGGIPEKASFRATLEAARGTSAASADPEAFRMGRRKKHTAASWIKEMLFGAEPAAPSPASKAAIAEDTSETTFAGAPDSAVFIHCKGGFGRSVVMACFLLIAKHDIPGRALLGWIRLARPGAITTPQQENLLASLNGAEDLWDYLGDVRSTGCIF